MAQTQLFTKKAQVHVVEEGTQDTYSAPGGSGTGIFLAEVPDVPMTIEGENFVPNYSRADFLSMDEIPGKCYATLNFRFPLKGSGSAGTAPEFGEFLKACGYEETTVASTSVTYTPLSVFDGAGGNPGPSYSCSILENGIRWAVAGAFGDFTLACINGEPVFIEATMQGKYQAVATDGLEAPTYQTSVAPAFMGASITIGGATPKGVSALNFTNGNVRRMGEDANETNGYYGCRITGRKSSGDIDPELSNSLAVDPFALWRAGTTGAINTGTFGSTGNQVALSIARASRRKPELVGSDGVRKTLLPFGVGSQKTDVEGTNADVSIAFT